MVGALPLPDGLIERQKESRDTAIFFRAVFKGQTPLMGLGDTSADEEADTGPAGFGGEEGDEQVGGIAEADAFILVLYFQLPAVRKPPHLDVTAIVRSRVRRISDENERGDISYRWECPKPPRCAPERPI
jgi:hypothetical protein